MSGGSQADLLLVSGQSGSLVTVRTCEQVSELRAYLYLLLLCATLPISHLNIVRD
jgi:hypothetical protein